MTTPGSRLLSPLLILLIAALPCAALAAETCYTLESSASRVHIELSAGSLSATGALTRFYGVMLLNEEDLTRSRVKLIAYPSSVEIDGPPHLNMLLQPLLQGEAGGPVVFTSTSITPRRGDLYLVKGVSRQAGRREEISLEVKLSRTAGGRALASGSLADGGGRIVKGLAGSVEFHLLFIARPDTSFCTA